MVSFRFVLEKTQDETTHWNYFFLLLFMCALNRAFVCVCVFSIFYYLLWFVRYRVWYRLKSKKPNTFSNPIIKYVMNWKLFSPINIVQVIQLSISCCVNKTYIRRSSTAETGAKVNKNFADTLHAFTCALSNSSHEQLTIHIIYNPSIFVKLKDWHVATDFKKFK